MIRIAPSVLAADFTKLGDEVESLNNTAASMLHIDIMDGHFVPNISFGYDIVKQMRKRCTLFFDVHLMLSEPQKYIEEFVKAGANSITIHAESDCDIGETLDLIRSYNVMTALSIKPKTPVSAIKKYISDIDMLLIMSVEPGFGGQKFMPESLEKIAEARHIIKTRGLETLIEVDGGVNASTIADVYKAGCDIAVAGSAVYGKANRDEAINTLISIAGE